jgi:two-component system LytT family response regulator
VLWIEAAGDYAKVHTRQGKFLATSGLGSLEAQLDRTQFMPVHRSVLLYLPALRRLSPRSSGGWLAELEDGTKVPVGRKYVEKVKARFL